jgi:uncharacterized protein involved in exopolysaccharide biosynthesis
LSDDAAAHEAFERFGAPEIVAAHVVSERERAMSRLAAVFHTVWQRKWWLLAPTVLTAVVTSVLSYYFLPIRYRAETVIQVFSARVPPEYVRSTVNGDIRERISELSQIILSRTRLERIIDEFGMYQAERETASMPDVVRQMRNDIDVTFLGSDRSQENELGQFRVGFESSDPKLAMMITERLAAMIITENLTRREVDVDATAQFVGAQIADMRTRIIAYEKTIDDLRKQSGGRPLSQADLLPYEVLQERYKALLVMSEQSRMARNLERRQIGEQFKIIDGARVPERPVGPSRASVNVMGTLAGLVLGLVVVGARGRSRTVSG